MLMTQFSEQQFTVQPNITQVNKMAVKARQIAITSIKPIFNADVTHLGYPNKDLQALRIKVEGPQNSINYFHRLLEGGHLTVLS
jgi:hypothetical protein